MKRQDGASAKQGNFGREIAQANTPRRSMWARIVKNFSSGAFRMGNEITRQISYRPTAPARTMIMNQGKGLDWIRIGMGSLATILVPILLLVGVVFVYGMVKEESWPAPAAFAPRAGAWVGPLGGFCCAFVFAYWAARGDRGRPLAHGLAVGLLSSLLDFVAGFYLVGASLQTLMVISYGGRIIAGILGGWLALDRLHYQTRRIFACTPSQLWRCLSDVDLLKQWISNMVEEIPDDAAQTGLGAKSTLKMREGNKIVDYRMVVTAWHPERCMMIRLSQGSFAPGMEVEVRYELEQGPDQATILDYQVEFRLKGLFFRLMGPVILLASAGNAGKELNKLKFLAEAQAP